MTQPTLGGECLQQLQDAAAAPEAGMTTMLLERQQNRQQPVLVDDEELATESPFLGDPFMALQNDLDDVSEVIKLNLVHEASSSSNNSGGSSPSLRPASADQTKLEMELLSEYQRDVNANADDGFEDDPGKERHIGQIVHLLQQSDSSGLRQQPLAHLKASTSSPLMSRAPHREHRHFEQLELTPIGPNLSKSSCLAEQQPPQLPFGGQQPDPMIGGHCGTASPFQGQRQQFGHNATLELGNQQPQANIFDDFERPVDLESFLVDENGSVWAQLQYQQQQQQQQQQMAPAGLLMESPPPVEPSRFGGVKLEAAPHQQREMAAAAKNDLIRMLLEMSPEELENLRKSRTRQSVAVTAAQHPQHLCQPADFQPSQPIFIQTTCQQPLVLQHQQQQQLSPPLDPPPPLPQLQMDFQQQQQMFGQQSHFLDYGMQMGQPPPPLPPPNFFYPSPIGSAALTSPVSNGAFPSLAPSEYLEEESAMDELWTEADMMGEEEGLVPGMDPQQGMAAGSGQGRKKKRRTAHNLIEKKYRCSINDRINQLKEMLASEETSRLSKSATLRRAVDHIQALRAKNAELAGENGRLKQALEMAGLPTPPAPPRDHASRLMKQESHHQQRQQNFQHGGPAAHPPNGQGPKNPRGRVASTRKSAAGPAAAAAGPRDQSRVTLCVFMFMLLAFNPLALFLGTPGDAVEETQTTQAHLFGNHRTLAGDDRFEAQFGQEPAMLQRASTTVTDQEPSPSAFASFLWQYWPAWLRHSLVWLLNALFVFAILNRLLVSGEPVADRRSPRWDTFLETRRKAGQAVAAGNWKEAQRQLDESLQLLERPLPSSGGLDEWMSLTWQIIRHLLNVLWIGRWFARRRRPSVQSQKSVCRSHAATALVYHQLHQLHLLGVDGIGLTQGGALNLALLAANLAESAGSSAISHALRAEIYACAGLRCRLCLPRWLRRIIAGYFFRRAKRHVSKSHRLEATELNSLQWLFHPLARHFLAEPSRLASILGGSGSQRNPNFPFSDSAQAAKPLQVLRDAFKMHLFDGLLFQLDSAEGKALRVADFVEQSQLLLQICSSDIGCPGDDSEMEGNRKGQAMFDLLSPGGSTGDEICTWWTHLLSGALHWRHGDLIRARQHCAIVRRCPRGLGQNDLALAVGLAFCSRKICLEDRQRAAWAELVLLHCQRSFAHLRKAARHCQWREIDEQHSQGTDQIQRRLRLLCSQWLLSSLLDLCSFSFGPEQLVPLEVRRLYSGVLGLLEREQGSGLSIDPKKLAMFKQLGQTLCGAEPFLENDRLTPTPSPAPSSIGEGSYKASSGRFQQLGSTTELRPY